MFFDRVEVHEFVTDAVLESYNNCELLVASDLFEKVKVRWPGVPLKIFLRIYRKCVFKAIAGRRGD